MKRVIILLLTAFLCTNLSAQSSEVIASAYKQIYRMGGSWGEWPNHWTTYESEERSKPTIRITIISEGDLYRMQMFIDGIVEIDCYLRYDSAESERVREEWGEEYINCYKDTESEDYIYTEVVSLKSLAKDNAVWASDEDSKIYFMIYSEDYAVVIR